MALAWVLFVIVALLSQASITLAQTYQQVIEVNVNTPVGTVLGTVGSGITGLQLPFQQLLYGQNGGGDIFNVSKSDGKIILLVSLIGQMSSRYDFVCRSDNFLFVQVTIEVTGKDSGGPVFNPSSMSFEIPESAPVNAKYSLGAAKSESNTINFTRSYAIVSGNIDNAFGLTTTYVTDGNLYANLIIIGHLDYEVTPSYNLTIAAYDGSVPPRVGYLRVYIRIINVNDNQPVFNQSRYFAQVAENVPVGTTVARVFATDGDSGSSAQINYSIDRQRSDPNRNFDISNSGSIFVASALDYEKTPSYELIVQAKEDGSTGLVATAVVVITILNVNDNPPIINVAFLTDDGSSNIPETTEPSSYVAQISVTDPESSGSNSWCNVTMSGGNGYFDLKVQDGVISWIHVSTRLNRDKQAIFLLTIQAVDSGFPRLTSVTNITVTVIGDNGPTITFTEPVYFAEILENIGANSPVIQVFARSSDSSSLLRYQLVNASSYSFVVDVNSGLISTSKLLTSGVVRLTLLASDSMRPMANPASTLVVVDIVSVNNNAPAFEHSFYNFTIAESIAAGTCFATVRAS